MKAAASTTATKAKTMRTGRDMAARQPLLLLSIGNLLTTRVNSSITFFLCADRWRITPRAMRSRQADPSRRIILTLPTLIQFSQVLLISFNFFPFRTLFHHIRRWHLRHTFFFLFNYTRTYKIKKKKLKFKRRALGRDVLTARRLHWE